MKLIKLLFPKVYTSIFNEGYNKGINEYMNYDSKDKLIDEFINNYYSTLIVKYEDYYGNEEE
jgi:hypothetical protein